MTLAKIQGLSRTSSRFNGFSGTVNLKKFKNFQGPATTLLLIIKMCNCNYNIWHTVCVLHTVPCFSRSNSSFSMALSKRAATSAFSCQKLTTLHIQLSHKNIKVKVKRRIAVCRQACDHRYGNSQTIWDHTVLPATRSWYSI